MDLYTPGSCKKLNIRKFYGLNRGKTAAAGEMEDMTNMTSLEYPCAAPCGKYEKAVSAPPNVSRAVAPDITNVSKMSGFTGVANGSFYYNGVVKSKTYYLSPKLYWEIERTGNMYIINGFSSSGGKYSSTLYYYNIDTDKFDEAIPAMDSLIVTAGKATSGNYLQTFRYAYDTVALYKVTLKDGTVLENIDFFDKYANSAGILPKDNIFEKVFEVGDDLTIENFPTGTENVGQTWTYSASYDEITTYKGYDYSNNNTVDTDVILNLNTVSKYAVTSAIVTGFDVSTYSISGVGTTYIHRIYFKLYNKNGDEIDFNDMGSMYCTGVKLSKRKRVFDHICIHNNRIWGTSPTGNQIFASASDDIFSFSPKDIANRYSVRLSSDTPGTFSGICSLGADAVAFKSDSLSVICGTNPMNYSSYSINGIGCIDPRSIAVTPSGAIFLSYKGFCIFNGSAPVLISEKLHAKLKSAAAGFDGKIYYAYAGEYGRILMYNTALGLWHMGPTLEAVGFFPFGGQFFAAAADGIYVLPDETDGAADWSFTLAPIYGDTLDLKAVNEIWLRAASEKGATLTVSFSVDGGEFTPCGSFCQEGMHVFRCPVRAVKGNGFRIKISGSGTSVIYELEVREAVGGRRYKEY